MSRAREILREYRERRQREVETAATADRSAELQFGAAAELEFGATEENLRRLLRHVSAARQPSELFEGRLRRAMLGLAAEQRSAPRRQQRPLRLVRPVWVPVAVLLVAGVLFAWQRRSIQMVVQRPASIPRSGPMGDQFSMGPRIEHPQRARERSPADSRLYPRIGLVLVPQGELRRLAAGEKHWKAIESGMAVHLGDTLQTGANADASIVFLDGSINWLAHDTTLLYAGTPRPRLQRPDLLRLTRGETRNQVEEGGPVFTVETPTARAVVHSTSFSVALGPKGETKLKVLKGLVELRNETASVLVPAGMQSVALAGHAPQPPIRMNPVAAPRPGEGTHPRKPRLALPAAPGHEPDTDDQGKVTTPQSSDAAPNPSLPRKPAAEEAAPQPPGSPASSSGGVNDGGRQTPISTGR